MLGGEYVDAKKKNITIPVGQKGIPYVAYALIKAQKISPKLVDGVCKSIPANKISSLRNKNMRSALEEAEKKLEVAREIVKTLQIEEKAIAAPRQT